MLNAQSSPTKKDQAGQEYESVVSKNVAIHVMSEKFRSQAAVISGEHKKTGLVIMLLGLFLIALFGAGAYYYFFIYSDNREPLEQVQPGPQTDPATPTDPVASTTPTDPVASTTPTDPTDPVSSGLKTYLGYLNELQNIITIDDYYSMIGRYGSAAYTQSLEAQQIEAGKLSPADKGEFLSLIRKRMPAKAELETNLKENMVGANSSLSYNSSIGAIQIMMIKEGSEFKIDQEAGFIYTDLFGSSTTIDAWISRKLNSQQQQSNAVKGADSDMDGLTDSEESLIGSYSNNPDSDRDGFSDHKELTGGYNPAGNGNIESNTAFNKYVDNMFNYQCLFPVSWEFKKIESSVFFKKSEQEFFQIVVIPNPDKSDIKKWYMDTFSVTDIPADKQMFSQGSAQYRSWSGVRSADGRTVYLTDENREYIYDIAYSIGLSQKVEYWNIYNLLLSSFKINKSMASQNPQAGVTTQ